jgi:hypothetical protein
MTEYQLIVPLLVTVGLTDKTYLQTSEQFASFMAASTIKIFDISYWQIAFSHALILQPFCAANTSDTCILWGN